VVLDEAGAQPARDHCGDGADRDRPGEALVDGLDRALPQRVEEGDREGDHLVPEVGDRRHQGAGVKGDVEGLVERIVLLQEGVVLKPGDEDQVPRGGDRQELGEALDDPE
jgi:hypothetical protein